MIVTFPNNAQGERIVYQWQKGGFKRVDFISFITNTLGPAVVAYRNRLPRAFANQPLRMVMDNASIHKGKPVEEALQAIGLVPVYLSPYSPVFNPCELVFGHIKRNLRSVFVCYLMMLNIC